MGKSPHLSWGSVSSFVKCIHRTGLEWPSNKKSTWSPSHTDSQAKAPSGILSRAMKRAWTWFGFGGGVVNPQPPWSYSLGCHLWRPGNQLILSSFWLCLNSDSEPRGGAPRSLRERRVQFSSVALVLSDSLGPCGLQHARLLCSSPSPRACSSSCPLSRWCHPTISSCHPLLLLPSIFPSIRVFSNQAVLHIRWPKDWSFNFSISPSNEHLGLISFRIDWLDLLAVQGTLKSLLQHQSSKASILWCSAFFIVQLSHPYMTTGKTIVLTRQTFFLTK